MPAIAEMPDLDQAIARLEAAEQAETNIAPIEVETEQVEPAPQQPVETTPASIPDKPDSKPSDTPAEAEPKPPTEPKPVEPKTNESKFAKDKQRRDDSWKALNTAKAEFETKQAAIVAREQQIARREENFKLSQSKASQRFTPQQYQDASVVNEQNAQSLALQADGMERRADQLENDGKLADAALMRQQAQEKRDEAATERGFAKKMKAMAAQPQTVDPTAQQILAQREQQKQHYTMEAAKQWPQLAEKGSPFQVKMAEHLNAAAQQGLHPDEFPIMMYHAARLTAAETAAARVPVMEKELGELRAKVKDFEKLTSPGGGNPSAQTIPKKGAKTDAEEGEELRRMAESIS